MNLKEIKAMFKDYHARPIRKTLEKWLTDNKHPEPKIILDWVAALESGEYRQGHFQLRDKYDKYCCLGVLCEAGQLVSDTSTDIVNSIGDRVYIYEGQRSSSKLPPAYAEKLQLTLDCQFTDGYESQIDKLAVLNDYDGLNFNEIAYLIKSYPHLLFTNKG